MLSPSCDCSGVAFGGGLTRRINRDGACAGEIGYGWPLHLCTTTFVFVHFLARYACSLAFPHDHDTSPFLSSEEKRDIKDSIPRGTAVMRGLPAVCSPRFSSPGVCSRMPRTVHDSRCVCLCEVCVCRLVSRKQGCVSKRGPRR